MKTPENMKILQLQDYNQTQQYSYSLIKNKKKILKLTEREHISHLQ